MHWGVDCRLVSLAPLALDQIHSPEIYQAHMVWNEGDQKVHMQTSVFSQVKSLPLKAKLKGLKAIF